MMKRLFPHVKARRALLMLSILVMAGLAIPAGFGYQKSVSAEIRIQPVRGNVYMLSGAGANVTVLIGPDGVMLVDTGVAEMTDKVLEAVQKLSNKPIRYIVNTQIDADHTSGNERMAKAGAVIAGGTVFADAGQTAAVVAHENVLLRMSAPTGNQVPTPAAALPTDTFVNDGKKFSPSVIGEPVQIFYEPAAHTDGDGIVFFRRSDVISTGDIFLTTGYPVIDVERGGTIQGVLDGLNHILDLAIPDSWMENGTMVIPGHGRLCDSSDVAYYRDMLTIIRDRVQDMIKKGMTLQQVKASKPTRDYDPRYGGNANWTPDMFVEAVYQTLIQKKK